MTDEMAQVITEPKNGVRIVKSRDTLPVRRAKLLEDIQHLRSQLGRLSEVANKIYAEAVHLTSKE